MKKKLKIYLRIIKVMFDFKHIFCDTYIDRETGKITHYYKDKIITEIE
jgi:hypothetical protein